MNSYSPLVRSLILSAALTAFPASLAWAAPVAYGPVPAPGGDAGVKFAIKFTAGTHHGVARKVTGAVSVDADAQILSAKFSVPLESLDTGNATRDCHMRESMGIDYTHSQFPGSHVCDSQHQLPATGPDSVAFPAIEFELLSFRPAAPGASISLENGRSYSVLADGRFTLHGVSRQVSAAQGNAVPLQVTVIDDRGTLNVKTGFNLSLADFGIVVKPILGLSVADTAKVDLDLLLTRD